MDKNPSTNFLWSILRLCQRLFIGYEWKLLFKLSADCNILRTKDISSKTNQKPIHSFFLELKISHKFSKTSLEGLLFTGLPRIKSPLADHLVIKDLPQIPTCHYNLPTTTYPSQILYERKVFHRPFLDERSSTDLMVSDFLRTEDMSSKDGRSFSGFSQNSTLPTGFLRIEELPEGRLQVFSGYNNTFHWAFMDKGPLKDILVT